MVTYDLLIRLIIKNKNPRLAEKLRPRELLSNSGVTLTINVHNIGDKRFPGGEIQQIGLKFGKIGGWYWDMSPGVQVPPVDPGESQAPDSFNLVLGPRQGACVFNFSIVTGDKTPILYYKRKTDKPRESEYRSLMT